jgi:hypothetical protein
MPGQVALPIFAGSEGEDHIPPVKLDDQGASVGGHVGDVHIRAAECCDQSALPGERDGVNALGSQGLAPRVDPDLPPGRPGDPCGSPTVEERLLFSRPVHDGQSRRVEEAPGHGDLLEERDEVSTR